MALITETMLRKLVREMLLEADGAAGLSQEMTSAAQASVGVAGRAQKMISGEKFEAFKKFIADVLAGKVIVTRSRNTPDHNLFVNAFLGFYGTVFLKGELPSGASAAASRLQAPSARTPGVTARDVFSSRSASFGQAAAMNESADDLFNKMALPTQYPEEAIKYAQETLKLQVDGDFGRQTMAALASGGKIVIPPTSIKKMQTDRGFADLIAQTVATGVKLNLDKTDDLRELLAGMQPQAAEETVPAGLKKSQLSPDTDVPPPSIGISTVPSGTVKTGPGATIRVDRAAPTR
jgi:hypothetical protein